MADLRADELAERYGRLEAQLLRRWDAPLLNDFLAMIFSGVLGRLCAGWLGDASLQNGLLSGEGGLISTEPARRVKAMAQMATGDADFARALRDEPLEPILEMMRGHADFEAAYQDYLDGLATGAWRS